MSARNVFGRIRNEEVGPNGLYHFEMRKSRYDKAKKIEGGVVVRKRHAKAVQFVTFTRLAEGVVTTRELEGRSTTFVLVDAGVEVRFKGSKGAKVIPWAVLANLSKQQPTLFV